MDLSQRNAKVFATIYLPAQDHKKYTPAPTPEAFVQNWRKMDVIK